jgi:hypothetical protein
MKPGSDNQGQNRKKFIIINDKVSLENPIISQIIQPEIKIVNSIEQFNNIFSKIVSDFHDYSIISKTQFIMRLKFLVKIINRNRRGDFKLIRNRCLIYNIINEKLEEFRLSKIDFKRIYERMIK